MRIRSYVFSGAWITVCRADKGKGDLGCNPTVFLWEILHGVFGERAYCEVCNCLVVILDCVAEDDVLKVCSAAAF